MLINLYFNNYRKILIIILWILLFFFTFLSLLILINHESIWYGEAHTIAIIKNKFLDILKIIAIDFKPPLYYIMLKMITLIFGESLIVVRLFTIAGTLALMSMGLFPVRKILGNTGGLFFSYLILIFPAFISFSIDGSFFIWGCFFTTGCIIYGYILTTNAKLINLIKFGFFTVCCFYINYYSLIAALITIVFNLIWFFINDKRRLIIYFNSLIIIILFLPWLFFLIDKSRISTLDYLMQGLSIRTIWNSLIIIFTDRFSIYPSFFGLIGILLLFFIIFTGLKISKNNNHRLLILISSITFILTFIFIVIYSIFVKNILNPSFCFILSGLIIVSLSCSITFFDKKTILIICAVLFIVSLPQNIFIRIHRINGPMNEVNNYIKYKLKSSDVFIHDNEITMALLIYYFPSNRHFLYTPYIIDPDRYKEYGENLLTGDDNDLSNFLINNNNFWVVSLSDSPIKNIFDEINKVIGKSFKTIFNKKEFKTETSWLKIKIEYNTLNK